MVYWRERILHVIRVYITHLVYIVCYKDALKKKKLFYVSTYSVVMIWWRGRRLGRSVLFLGPGHPAGFSGCCGGHVIAVIVLLVLVTLRLLRLPGVREPQVRFAGVHVVPHTISPSVPRSLPLHFVSSLKLKPHKRTIENAFVARWVGLGSFLYFVSLSFRKNILPYTFRPSSDDERFRRAQTKTFHSIRSSIQDERHDGRDLNIEC